MRTRHVIAALVAAILPAVAAHADVTIDLSKATSITLPTAGNAPVAFRTSDGKTGWVRRLSNETIPTPAFAKGRIYTGAGMGSRTFLALDALTGSTLWEKTTQDNGPTSPVVNDDSVAYNTESCHTESRDPDSGELLWSELTGGTLLTQPVIADNMLVIPHPTMARKSPRGDDTFRMLGVDLKSGKHFWDANMTADVMGAPVAAGGRIFFTCTDGRLFSIKTSSGGGGWHTVANATSAPVVVNGIVAVTTEEKKGNADIVAIRRYAFNDGTLLDETPLAPTVVGNAILAKTQRAEWDYQGPKIASNSKLLFNAPGNTLNAVDIDTGKPAWRATLPGLSTAVNALTPPALGKENLYLGSAKGHILAVKQSDASLTFAYNINQPLASQPILANGNLYFGTANGLLICLKLDNPDATNWHAWGGNANHNKVD